jgi:hypothetical protein
MSLVQCRRVQRVLLNLRDAAAAMSVPQLGEAAAEVALLVVKAELVAWLQRQLVANWETLLLGRQ